MKRRIAIVAVLAAVAGALVGCTSTTTVVTGSTVRVAVAQPLSSLNADTSAGRSNPTNAAVAALTGTGFAYRDAAGALVADPSFGTATIVARDPLTVRYTVADPARWSDGTPVDATDLLLAWAANSGALNAPNFDDTPYVDPQTGRYTASFPTDVVHFDGAIGGGLETATRMPDLSSDHRSLTVHYDAFQPAWQTLLAPGLPAHVLGARLVVPGATAAPGGDAAAASARIQAAIQTRDPVALAAASRAWNSDWALDGAPSDAALQVAAGPYTVSAVDAGSVTLSANTQYRGDRAPHYEKIVLRVSTDPLATVKLLADHQVDVIMPTASADVVAALAGVAGAQLSVGTAATLEHLELQISGSRSGVFADPRIRQAFLATVPRQQIVDQLVRPVQPDAVVADSFTLRPGDPRYAAAVAANGSAAFAQPDAARAAALLAQAGNPHPEVCVLYDPANVRRAAEFRLIQAGAALAGFVVTDCANAGWDTLLGVTGAYDAALYSWDATRLVPGAGADVFQSGASVGNTTHYANPQVDALLAQLRVSDDPAARADALAAIDPHLFADAVGLPLFAPPTVTAVAAGVAGVSPSAYAPGVFWNAWAWHPATASPSPSGGLSG